MYWVLGHIWLSAMLLLVCKLFFSLFVVPEVCTEASVLALTPVILFEKSVGFPLLFVKARGHTLLHTHRVSKREALWAGHSQEVPAEDLWPSRHFAFRSAVDTCCQDLNSAPPSEGVRSEGRRALRLSSLNFVKPLVLYVQLLSGYLGRPANVRGAAFLGDRAGWQPDRLQWFVPVTLSGDGPL